MTDGYQDSIGLVCFICGAEAWARADGDWVCFGHGLMYMGQPKHRRQYDQMRLAAKSKHTGVTK